MGRKAKIQGSKKEDILSAAQSCFLENGFDGTSVRQIMKKAGAEVGLFYYYFKNKDEAFDVVLDCFFAGYRAGFSQIVKFGRRNPCRLMEDFFEYMERETVAFRKKYAHNIHRTVRWAIREHTLTIIEPYLRQIIDIQSEYYGVAPALDADVATLYLTHGVGSAILHEDSVNYLKKREEIKHGVSLIMGMPISGQNLRIPVLASQKDIPELMKLVCKEKKYFPGLNEAQFEAELKDRTEKKEVWTFHDANAIPAVLIVSKERRELDFLLVSKNYRQCGLGKKLVETAAAQFPVGSVLSVITYRIHDELGASAVGFYRQLGFSAGEELTMFHYPCQRYSLVLSEEAIGFKKKKNNKE